MLVASCSVLLKSDTEAIADGIAKIRGQADDRLRPVGGSGDPSSATNVAAAKFNGTDECFLVFFVWHLRTSSLWF